MKAVLYGVSRGSSIKNFPPISVIKLIKFPVPSIELQHEVVNLVSEVEAINQSHIKSANTTLELLDSYLFSFIKLDD